MTRRIEPNRSGFEPDAADRELAPFLRPQTIADDGFTAAVLARLSAEPERMAAPAFRFRRSVLAIAWIAALVVIVIGLPGIVEELQRTAIIAVFGQRITTAQVFGWVAMLGSLAWLGVWAAAREE